MITTEQDNLPVCFICKETIPEMEIYYTIMGEDYCQSCTPNKLSTLSPSELDAWLNNPE